MKLGFVPKANSLEIILLIFVKLYLIVCCSVSLLAPSLFINSCATSSPYIEDRYAYLSPSDVEFDENVSGEEIIGSWGREYYGPITNSKMRTAYLFEPDGKGKMRNVYEKSGTSDLLEFVWVHQGGGIWKTSDGREFRIGKTKGGGQRELYYFREPSKVEDYIRLAGAGGYADFQPSTGDLKDERSATTRQHSIFKMTPAELESTYGPIHSRRLGKVYKIDGYFVDVETRTVDGIELITALGIRRTDFPLGVLSPENALTESEINKWTQRELPGFQEDFSNRIMGNWNYPLNGETFNVMNGPGGLSFKRLAL